MILSKDQICRYMRHILIPEISGQGQRKILDSSAVFFGEDLKDVSLALYYISASGIGQVYCHIANASNWEKLSENLSDLNSDTKIQLLAKEVSEASEVQATTRIISGSLSYVEKTLRSILKTDCREKYIPTIVAVNNGWSGAVQTFINQLELEAFSKELGGYPNLGNINASCCFDNISAYFSSLIAVIEHIKLTLSLGKPLSEALYHDLSAMEFDFVGSSTDLLNKLRSIKVPENSLAALSDFKALIIGCGGLGSPAAYALAASGIGRLGLVDFDDVELSNLNRQIMHSTLRLGMPKVQSAEIFLRQINSNISLDTYYTGISKDNVRDIISSYDIIIGGLDNLPARYILNDACYAAKKPLIEAGALDISGLATSIIPDEGHCYRCIFPESKENSSLPSCSERGVLGLVPGVMGIIQAAEAIKLLTGIGRSLKNRILLFDVFDTDIYVADHAKNRYCELCGK
ncbi:MAG: hypothetical protein APF77_14635 [Clostridia bacterium BRH_c25]|nr:MAG: hypothetical protein APF77_14635 [Clostridia bacterium BRH_c25]